MKIMIIAGEVSGDMHAAKLVAAIRKRMQGLAFFGIGGRQMRGQGVETFYDVADMAVMGFVEVMRRFFFFRRVFHHMLELAAKERPSAVILVDYPGFNLRFAARTHAMGIKTIYYICPQVWAWNRRRIPLMARVIDHLITIFPFEKEVFRGTNLKVDFVGHPLVEATNSAMAEPAADLPWMGNPRVALLPGSRTTEIEQILPSMLETASIIEKKHPGASFIIAAPSEPVSGHIERILARHARKPSRLKIVAGLTHQALRQADAAMVASGTATVETALIGCPMIILYKMSPLTFFFAKMLVQVPHIGMVNIIAGRRICPEFIQNELKPEQLAGALLPLLTNTPERAAMISELERVKSLLGEGNIEDKAAALIEQTLSA